MTLIKGRDPSDYIKEIASLGVSSLIDDYNNVIDIPSDKDNEEKKVPPPSSANKDPNHSSIELVFEEGDHMSKQSYPLNNELSAGDLIR